MNKPICILLCILLICLSVVPVFADQYSFTDRTSFCTAYQNAITWNAPANASSYFISSFPNTNLQEAFDHALDYFDINTDDILYVFCIDSQNVQIITSEYPIIYSYPSGLLSGTIKLNAYFSSNPVIEFYQCGYDGSDYTNVVHNTYNQSSQSYASSTARNNFYGIYPYNIVACESSSRADSYILTSISDNGGGGDNPSPSYTFQNVTMSAPTVPYSPLYNQMMLARWDELSAKWPTQFANVVRGEWVFTDLDNAEIMGAILQFGGLFETYANHSYDFYNNVSLNLANGMTALTSSAEELSNMANNIELLTSVYASDQEVEARETAADNQQAIVDNFLDSEGEGYVSPSDISSVSSMSDDYKTHMSTDAQPSGIWDIFNSNHFGWFSQETVNQLDTTTTNQRGLNTFETPYLDEKIRDIYRSLGVNYDD